MTGVSVRIIGRESLQRKMARIPETIRGEVQDAVALSAFEVQGQAQRNIQRGGRSGRIYPPIKGRRGAPHQASAPGEFPKTDTGRLVSSIFAESQGLQATVGTDVEYGRYLEFGTRRMRARPWLFPTFRNLRRRIVRRIEAAIRKANRTAAG